MNESRTKNKVSKYIVETEIGTKHKKHLLYSLRSNKLLMIEPNLYKKYKLLENTSMSEREQKIFLDGQFLVPADTKELEDLLIENRDYNTDSEHLYYVIQPTANCNFGCDYCGQEHIDFNISEKTIQNTVNRIRTKLVETKKKELHIGWFGGEPLLALDKMRSLNTAIKKMLKELGINKYSGVIATNGYLLDLDIYKELVSDFKIDRLEITIDGDKDSHDKRRIEKTNIKSFDKIYSSIKSITRSKFYNNNLENCMISIRCNVDERNYLNVSNLLDILKNDDIHNKLIFYIAPIRDWGENNASSKSLSQKDLNRLVLDLKIKMLDLGFCVDNFLPKRNYGLCASIEGGMEMVDVFGKVWGCSETSLSPKYRDSIFSLGNVNKKEPIKKNKVFQNYFETIVDTKCITCSLLPICGTGCPKSMLEGTKKCYYSKVDIKEQMKVQATYNLLNESNKI